MPAAYAATPSRVRLAVGGGLGASPIGSELGRTGYCSCGLPSPDRGPPGLLSSLARRAAGRPACSAPPRARRGGRRRRAPRRRPLQVFADALSRALSADPTWIAVAAVAELLSFGGYIALFWLVGRRATPRLDLRAGAEITLGGAAATRLLPTAGVGGAALTLWAIAKTGVGTRRAGRTLLTFLVLLYGTFLAGIAASGGAIALGAGGSTGHALLAGVAALAAGLAIGVGLAARPRGAMTWTAARGGSAAAPRCSAARCATRSASLRRGDARLLGAPAWWAFDAAVLWAVFHALGSPPSLAILAFAYFAGQVGNTIPIPGAVSGGMVGTLLAFGVAPDLALSSVLAYRAIAIWLPAPLGLVGLGALRARVARWAREDDDAAELVDAIVTPAARAARGGRAGAHAGPAPGARRPVRVRGFGLARQFGHHGPDVGRSPSHPAESPLTLRERLPATRRERVRRPAGGTALRRRVSRSTSTASRSRSPRRWRTSSRTPTRRTRPVSSTCSATASRVRGRHRGPRPRPRPAGGAPVARRGLRHRDHPPARAARRARRQRLGRRAHDALPPRRRVVSPLAAPPRSSAARRGRPRGRARAACRSPGTTWSDHSGVTKASCWSRTSARSANVSMNVTGRRSTHHVGRAARGAEDAARAARRPRRCRARPRRERPRTGREGPARG